MQIHAGKNQKKLPGGGEKGNGQKIRFQVASLGQKKMELKREGREKTKHMQLTTTTQVLFSLSVINSSH